VQRRRDNILAQHTNSLTRSKYQDYSKSFTLDVEKCKQKTSPLDKRNIFHMSRDHNLLNLHEPIEFIQEIEDGFVLTMRDL
jgi:hypothetical protein